MWDCTDYELDWPRELLAAELVALRNHPYRGWAPTEIELLLAEAFHTGVPVAEFNQAVMIETHLDEQWSGRSWVDDLLAHLTEIGQYQPPRPYWPMRRGGAGQVVSPEPTTAEHFASVVTTLWIAGYLARDFARPCVDDDPDQHAGGDLSWELQQRLGVEKLWPLQPEAWDTDTFYGLIEVFHDLVARPRLGWDHQHNDCGRHFSDFDTDSGRRVYRALVNRLLAEASVELRLAEDGEDIGRLVHLVDDARTDLVERALASPDRGVASRIAHAIALFRGRDAAEHDKRSAVVALALVLEERRPFLKTALFSDDEGALFHIANKFAIRHQDTKQRTDYDPMFLDWIFWSYLSTIELSDRLLARQTTQTSTATP